MVEQQSQSVVGEVAVAAGDRLGVLDLQVEVLGWPVADGGMVEVRAQLGSPGAQRAAEAGQLRDRAVPQVGDELLGSFAGALGVGELVEHHQVLGDGPGQGELAGRIPGHEPGLEPAAGLAGEPVAAAAQYSADSVERVAGAAAVPGGLLLDPAADFVEAAQPEGHHVKRVEHADRVGQLGSQRGVESDRGAVPAFRLVRFPGPLPEPDVRLPALLTFLWVVIMRLPGLGGVGRGRRG